MLIPDDARRELITIRESMTEKAYVHLIWKLRGKEHPGPRTSKGVYPFERLENQSNVTTLKRVRGKV